MVEQFILKRTMLQLKVLFSIIPLCQAMLVRVELFSFKVIMLMLAVLNLNLQVQRPVEQYILKVIVLQ